MSHIKNMARVDFLWNLEQLVIISVYRLIFMVSITVIDFVYCGVRGDTLNKNIGYIWKAN